jgi:hypothetical protein
VTIDVVARLERALASIRGSVERIVLAHPATRLRLRWPALHSSIPGLPN